jgi:hypothetical protein
MLHLIIKYHEKIIIYFIRNMKKVYKILSTKATVAFRNGTVATLCIMISSLFILVAGKFGNVKQRFRRRIPYSTGFLPVVAVILLIVAGSFSACGKDSETEPITPCNPQTERLEDIQNEEARFFKQFPDDKYQFSSPFICEVDGIFTLHNATIFYEICNFPQYAKEWIVPDDGLSVIVGGTVFRPSRDHGFNPATHVFYDLVLTSLKRQ